MGLYFIDGWSLLSVAMTRTLYVFEQIRVIIQLVMSRMNIMTKVIVGFFQILNLLF